MDKKPNNQSKCYSSESEANGPKLTQIYAHNKLLEGMRRVPSQGRK